MRGYFRVAAALFGLASLCAGQAAGPYFGRGVWRGNIVDFRIVDGWAIVEGDIIAGRAADLRARYQALLNAETPADKSRQLESIVVSDQARLWPGGAVPYEVDPAITNTTQIDAAIRHWNERTSLKLVPHNGEANYFLVTPYSDPSACASSTVGMQGGRQLLFASETCGANLLIHEIGHVIGLSHEQARSDRDQYVRVLWENMTKPGQSQYGVSVPSTDYGGYDYYSIMHYRGSDFSRNASATMETRPAAGIPIGQALVLSDGDIDAVNRLYGNTPASITISSTPPGLQLVVDGETITAPRAYAWAAGETHTVEAPSVESDDNGRYEYARWSDNGDRVHAITAKPETATLYTANFVRYNRFHLQVTPEGAGTVVLSPPSPDGTYRDSTLVSFRAVPADGYVFANWTGPFIDHNLNLTNLPTNPAGFFVDGDFQGFTARFVKAPAPSSNPVTRFASVLPSGGTATAPIRVDGRLYNTPVSFTWDPGGSHTIDIAASFPVGTDSSLRTFQSWNDGGDRDRTIVAGDQPITYTASYSLQYGMSLGTVGSGRVTTAPASSSFYFDQGSTVQVAAGPSAGNQFVGWGIDIGGNQNPKDVVVNESINALAFFGAATSVSNFASMNAARQRPNTQITGSSIFARISPGEVITINMQGVGPDAPVAAVPDAGNAISTRLAETRVLLNGVAVPVLAAAPGQITAHVPFSIAVLLNQAVGVQVEYQGRATGTGAVRLAATNPAIYAADGSGSGQGRVTNEDGGANGPATPAAKGSVVTLEATGLGVPDGTVADGRVSDTDGPRPKGALEVRIGAAVCEIVSAGLEAGQLGIYRIRVRVPDSARTGAATPLILTVDGAPSQFDVTMAVQ